MSKAVVEDGLNLHEDVNSLAVKIRKALVIGEDGEVTVDKGLYDTLLPEGLTADTVKKVQTHHNNLVAATAHAVGEAGTAFLKSHKKVEHVHLEKFPMGRDSLRVNLARKAKVGGIGGVAVEHHGWITAKYTSGSAGTSGAAFKRIRDHHAKVGAGLFS